MTLEEVQQRIAADAEYVPPFWREKYEADAARNWDIFYSINSRNFFKVRCILSAARSARPVTDRASPTTQDRRYLDLEFEELRPSSTLVCLPCSPPLSCVPVAPTSRAAALVACSHASRRAPPQLCWKWAAALATPCSPSSPPTPTCLSTAATSQRLPWN